MDAEGLDLRHLAALEAVAHAGSFAKAAAGLGYTQPAISQQIAALERIVGQRLFERQSGPKPVTLTEAGELLLRHAEAIQARLSAAQADMDALAAGTAGTLRVGTFQSVAARILPELVVRHWWENLLHNQRVQLIKLLLLIRGNQRIVVVNIPWYL